MPRISRRNYTLAQMFVFYERLAEDGTISNNLTADGAITSIELFNIAASAFREVNSEIVKITQSGAIIRSVAQREAQKEISLLKKIFNADITVNFKDRESIKTFIDTLNACLNLKKVYDRNVFLVSHSQGRKGVFSFFPEYLLAEWEDRWNQDLAEKVNTAIHNLKDDQVILEAIKQVIAPELKGMVPAAINRMFNAKPELKAMFEENIEGTKEEKEKYSKAYSDLLDAIQGFSRLGNSLANQLIQIYKLDEIADFLSEAIFEKVDVTKVNKEIEGKFKVNMSQRGGLTLQAIENTVFNMIAQGITNHANNNNMHVFYTGKRETGFKADNIISFGIDSQIIQNALNGSNAEKTRSVRKRNKSLFEYLNEKLKNIKDGYIVYSSDKNYAYNKGFEKRGGFQAENINLQTYQQIMKYTEKNARTFTGAILQTAEGAIAGIGYRHTMEEAMAHDIAYFLFDDFKTIGNEVGAGDTQAIHLMNLNGILFPLSVFLSAFADAIEEEVGRPDDFVRVEIEIPGILFPTAKQQSEWQEKNKASGYDAWNYQREVALAKTKIEVHFLKSFRELITRYLGN